VLSLIGDTPLVELPRFAPRPGLRIFAKLESTNPSGSVKDRVALCLVERAEARGDIEPGAHLVEASSGNTGIALAMIARQRGYTLTVVVPEAVPPPIRDLLVMLGAEVVWTEPRVGMKGAIELAERLAKEHGWYLCGQFTSPCNPAVHYRTTGAEIAGALPEVDAFVAGIGTGGTLMGVGRRLREQNPAVKLIGVEPHMGERLQGLRCLEEAWQAPLVDLALLDARYLIGAADALAMTAEVASREGLVVGVSSGATLRAALRFAETRMDTGSIVCMFGDGGWKYLPTHPWKAARERDPDLDEIHWW